jgi:putative acetyltransferase
MDDGPLIRPGLAADAATIAAVGRTSRRHFLPYLPDLHSLSEDEAFVKDKVLATCRVNVVEQAGFVVGFCAFRDGWVDHLYILPSHVGRGLGTMLLNAAKAQQAFLQLWVFQQNMRAIRFYVGHGFRKVLETDGAGNEERMPDALYEWLADRPVRGG